MALINQYLKQVENELFTLKPCTIYIERNDYSEGDEYVPGDTEDWFKTLVSKIIFDDEFSFNLILDYSINIIAADKEDSDEFIIYHFKADDKILEVGLQTTVMTQQMAYVERLLGGRELTKDVNHLYRRLKKVYSGDANVNSVHLELLLSQCLRSKKDPQLPARLTKPFDPVMINIKQIVFNSGFMQGLCFENINNAINVGLTTDDKLEPSILERVLTGKITEEK